MRWLQRLFGKNIDAPKQSNVAHMGLVGHEVHVVQGPPTYMDRERRHQRSLRRMNLASAKLKEMEDQGVAPDDPRYEAWSIEYQKQSLAVREYNFKNRRKN